MTAPLVQRLSLVVDAATGNTESRMDAVAASVRETGEAAQRSAGQVAAAADRVAQAQLKRDDAADRVALAERRLQEVQERSAAGSSQVLAAEQRLEAARRNLHVSTRAVETAERDQVAVQRDAAESTARLATEQERVRGTSDRMGQQLGSLTALAKGYAAFELGGAVRDSVSGFLDGARGAATLATSMNATTEQGGQLSSLFSSLGLEAADLLEIQAEFATKVGYNGKALAEFGAEVKKNDDGTTNWALTLTDALTQLQKIPDATVRNATGFRLFGEEGYKQLSRLLSSGVSVEDALERIGTPFDDEDVEQTRRYDAAMADLAITGTTLGQGLGSVLVPVITTVANGLNVVVDAAGAVPGPLGAATAAAVLWGVAQRSAGDDTSFLAGALDNGRQRIGSFRDAVADASNGTGTLATGMGVARVAGGGLLSALGGPLGAAVVGLGVGFTVLNAVTGENKEQAEAAAGANADLAQALKESSGVITQSVREQAATSAQQAGILATTREAGIRQGDVTAALLGNEAAYRRVTTALDAYTQAELERANGNTEDAGFVAAAEAAGKARDELDDLRGTTEENATAQKELAGELAQTADLEAVATAATDALTQALQDGAVPTAELTRLAHDAAAAQDAAAFATDRSEAALEAYRATTTGATAAMLEHLTAAYSLADAEFAFLDAMDAANDATNDATTSVDEVAQAHNKLMQAAIASGEAAGEAAVQSREAAGDVLTDVDRANVAAGAMIENLRGKLDQPGLSDKAKGAIGELITRLEEAQAKGDVQAVLTLTGTEEAAGELDATTEDRETTVQVETRGGPAVTAYLSSITNAERLAIIRTESRGGPAVVEYLNGLATERLAIIRVETRGGPDVDRYLDELAGKRRTAVIDVQRSEAGGAGGGRVGAAGLFGAPLAGGPVTVQVYPQVEQGGRLTAQGAAVTGREVVAAIRTYEQENGTGWRKER